MSTPYAKTLPKLQPNQPNLLRKGLAQLVKAKYGNLNLKDEVYLSQNEFAIRLHMEDSTIPLNKENLSFSSNVIDL